MALIHHIIPFSCVDGPGNRLVIFFQGCNFRCTYCHNPETINICNHCGICVETCPSGALTVEDGSVQWEKSSCIDCNACQRACPRLSSPKVRDFSVDDLMIEIKKAEPFIQGITVSGGECTLQIPFLTALFRRVKAETALTCLVDTNGGVSLKGESEFLDLADGFMLDVKHIDDVVHRELTGASNVTTLKNLDLLLAMNKLVEVRTVILPDLDMAETVKTITAITNGQCEYVQNPYRPHGVRPEGLERHGF